MCPPSSSSSWQLVWNMRKLGYWVWKQRKAHNMTFYACISCSPLLLLVPPIWTMLYFGHQERNTICDLLCAKLFQFLWIFGIRMRAYQKFLLWLKKKVVVPIALFSSLACLGWCVCAPQAELETDPICSPGSRQTQTEHRLFISLEICPSVRPSLASETSIGPWVSVLCRLTTECVRLVLVFGVGACVCRFGAI
jgi:hypothetical protein